MALSTEELNNLLTLGGSDPNVLDMVNDNGVFTLAAAGPSGNQEPTFNAPNRSTESFLSSFSNIRNLLGIARPQNRPIGRVIENQLLRPETSPGFQLGQNLLAGRQRTRQQDLAERLRKSGIGFSGPALQMSNMIEREGDIDIGNLGLAAGEQGVRNALSFEPQVQNTFLTELALGTKQSEASKTRELLRDIARSGSQANIGELIAALLGGSGGVGGLLGQGITGLVNLLKQGGGAVGSAGKAIFDWLTGQGIDPLTASESQLISAMSRLNEEDLAGDFLGLGGGGEGSGGGGGGMGAPPTSPGLVQQLTDALGLTGGLTATTAATFPAFLSSVDAALAAAGIAPFTGQPAMSSALAAAFPEFAASLGVEGAAAGVAGAGAAGVTAGAEAGGGLVGAGAGGIGSALAAAGIPLSIIGLLTAFMPRGETAKSRKQEAGMLSVFRQEFEQAVAQGKPYPLDQLRATGSFMKDATGTWQGTNDLAPKILASRLNAGVDVPIVGNNYIIPLNVTAGDFQAGQMSLRPTEGAQLIPVKVQIPVDVVKVKIDPITGQKTYRLTGDFANDPQERERDIRSEARSISRQD